mmetsp:Transcript_53267/g.88316  ORF Transcript_53267/g.88316 Transcript_53267/m.88316 type:complete len:215 (+) Transcript_53267:1310-1954(+)
MSPSLSMFMKPPPPPLPLPSNASSPSPSASPPFWLSSSVFESAPFSSPPPLLDCSVLPSSPVPSLKVSLVNEPANDTKNRLWLVLLSNSSQVMARPFVTDDEMTSSSDNFSIWPVSLMPRTPECASINTECSSLMPSANSITFDFCLNLRLNSEPATNASASLCDNTITSAAASLLLLLLLLFSPPAAPPPTDSSWSPLSFCSAALLCCTVMRL